MRDAAGDRGAYEEQEIAAILRRAAELQAKQEDAGAGSGITLAELERAAADIGIDPRFVREAAAERERGAAGEPETTLLELRREFAGEVTDEAWDEIVAELRRTFGNPGTVSQAGRSLQWQWSSDVGTVHVTVRPRNGRSEIEILTPVKGVLATGWILSSIASLPVAMITMGSLIKGADVPVQLALLATAGLVGAIMTGTRLGVGSWLRQDRRKLHRLLERLVARAEETMKAAPVSGTIATAAPAEQEVQTLRG